MLPPEGRDDARRQPAGFGGLEVDGERLRSHDRVLPGGDPQRVQVALGGAEPIQEVVAGRLRRMAVTSSIAPSCSVPVGSPSASRTIRPFAGSGVVRSIPEMARALELAHATWPSSLSKKAGRSGTIASRRCGGARRAGRRAATSRCQDPLPFRVRGRVGGDRIEVRGRIGQVVEVAAPGEHAALDGMDMRILESREERLAVELDHPRSRPDQRPHIRRAPDKASRPSRTAKASAGPASSVIVSTVAPRNTRSGRSVELMRDRS